MARKRDRWDRKAITLTSGCRRTNSSLAATLVDSKLGTADIWLTDITRGSTSRFTFGPSVHSQPVWSPDSKWLIYRNVRKGLGELFQKSAGGGGKDEPVHMEETSLAESNNLDPTDWSPDGRHLLFSTLLFNNQLWVLPLGSAGGDAKPFRFLDSSADQMHGNFSPDGHFVAYRSEKRRVG